MGLDLATCLIEIEVLKWCIVRTRPGYEYVVNGCGQVVEEFLEELEIGCVESGGALCINLGRSATDAFWIAGGEDHVGAFSTRGTSRLESDSGATTDHDNALT